MCNSNTFVSGAIIEAKSVRAGRTMEILTVFERVEE